ncbi:MAG: aldo/keto reductase [Bacteroidales bacterium]|jgi:predicted aldo/keto reductase-like oxidoreductase|nr:aldo/keto reductase [Bacteroidales bacterium]
MTHENTQNTYLNRRDFLKVLGGATLAVGALNACGDSAAKRTIARLSGNITGDMTYRINPKNGDRISLLGYGCMRWALRRNRTGGEEIDQDIVNKLVDTAIEHGVNFFDTSPVYVQGWSETATGIALSRHPRNSYYISTKLSNFDPSIQGFERSKEMYYNSLRNLQVDYIDYYLLHSIGDSRAFQNRYINNGILDFLKQEKAAGRIRSLGWSFHGEKEFFDYMLSLYDSGEFVWDFALIQLNYVDYRHASGRNVNAEYLNDELLKRGIPAMVMEPLLGGRLASLNEYLTEQLKRREPEASVASWAFRFAGQPSNVLTVLSGMTYAEHLMDNLATFSPLVPLTDEELALLEETAQIMLKYPTVPCTTCQYCMPCPFGIDIPGVFSFYNRAVNAGNVPNSSQDEDYRRARRAFLVGYDRAVERLRQATHCITCGKCVPHCPQNIDIPSEMVRIDNFVEQLRQGSL